MALHPPSLHPGYEGNLHCIFLNDKKCTVHQGRTGACRIFGLPELSKLGVEDLVECVNKGSTESDCSTEFITGWLRRLFLLNDRIYPTGDSPYFVRGLNLSCWLDIYFDSTIFFEPFLSIKQFLLDNLDLSFMGASYVPRTGIREKIDKITLFSFMLESGDAQSIKELLLSIRDGYPLTGTYFYEEATEYLKALEVDVIPNS